VNLGFPASNWEITVSDSMRTHDRQWTTSPPLDPRRAPIAAVLLDVHGYQFDSIGLAASRSRSTTHRTEPVTNTYASRNLV
jgi:hypothetical protein